MPQLLYVADKAKVEHRIISNEDLFYDPEMDDADQRWVDAHRARCRPSVTSSLAPGTSRKRRVDQLTKPATSDAVLNCPACMVVLCRDCQRYVRVRSTCVHVLVRVHVHAQTNVAQICICSISIVEIVFQNHDGTSSCSHC